MATIDDVPTAVTAFLARKKFIATDILKVKPYFVIVGKQPSLYDYDVVIKIAVGEPPGAILLRNHVLWTRSLANRVPDKSGFHIAPVLEDGHEGIFQWYVTPFVQGKPFAQFDGSRTSIDADTAAALLPNIIRLMRYIERTEAVTVAGLDARYGVALRKDKLTLLQNAISWARSNTPYLAELLQIVNANSSHLRFSNSHGDFTEINLIINPDNEPVLLDGEISDSCNYKYYDVAEFYCRLYTRACSPSLAKTFLKLYMAELPKQSAALFKNNFLCLSALRSIGNFTEIDGLTEGKSKDARIEFGTRYSKAIVTYDIFQV